MIRLFLSWHGRLARGCLHFKATPLASKFLASPLDRHPNEDDQRQHQKQRDENPERDSPFRHHIMSSSSSLTAPFFFSSWMFRPSPRISLQSTSNETGVPASNV